MNNTLKKIKHLRATIIEWADEHRKLPQEVPGKWKDDLNYITKLENGLLGGTVVVEKETMKYLNKLYREYRTIYEKNY
ncbi:hypothetical protein H8D04_00440 [bacterium]|nr:hypothetical protein [bacterium]